MAESESRMESLKKQGFELIDCGHHISVSDINRVFKDRQAQFESHRKLFTESVGFLVRCEDYILRDCELILKRGTDIEIAFYAGDSANRYEVIMKEDNEVEVICTKKSQVRNLLGEGLAGIVGRLNFMPGSKRSPPVEHLGDRDVTPNDCSGKPVEENLVDTCGDTATMSDGNFVIINEGVDTTSDEKDTITGECVHTTTDEKDMKTSKESDPKTDLN